MNSIDEAYNIIREMIEARYQNYTLQKATISNTITYEGLLPTAKIAAEVTIRSGNKHFTFSASAPSLGKLINQLEQTLP